jgi:regulator of RNase E activity RraB
MSIFSHFFGCSGDKPNNVETKNKTERRLAMDREVINALHKAGANLSKPHTIEHHFVTYERKKADAVVMDELANEYKVSEIRTLNDEKGVAYFYFDLLLEQLSRTRNPFLLNPYA